MNNQMPIIGHFQHSFENSYYNTVSLCEVIHSLPTKGFVITCELLALA